MRSKLQTGLLYKMSSILLLLLVACSSNMTLIDGIDVQSEKNDYGAVVNDFLTCYEISLCTNEDVALLSLLNITQRVPIEIFSDTLLLLHVDSSNENVFIYASANSKVYKKRSNMFVELVYNSRIIRVELQPQFWNKSEARLKRKACWQVIANELSKEHFPVRQVQGECGYLPRIR